MSEVFPEGVSLPSKLFLPKKIISIRIKYYLSHSTRCRDRGHTRQLRVKCGKPPAKIRTAPIVNPLDEIFNTIKALALTQKGLQREH